MSDQRVAQRYSLLIRPAKLVCSQGEFVCVLRDVSSTGVSARLFHALPACERYTLELQSGDRYEMARVWARGNEAGFAFDHEIDVDQLIREASSFPKRGLRLALEFPITVVAGLNRAEATVLNLSQQGARLECGSLYAIEQNLRLSGEALRETRAKVRWRRNAHYGVVFDDTFSLRDFALLVARLQAPGLLDQA
ncbi:MAG: PilZ domain-containing protein [Erythrobacter sp.]